MLGSGEVIPLASLSLAVVLGWEGFGFYLFSLASLQCITEPNLVSNEKYLPSLYY